MPLNKDNEIDYTANDFPKCPYCDEEHNLDDVHDIYRDGLHELYCGNCGSEYEVYTSVSHSFSTESNPVDEKGRGDELC